MIGLILCGGEGKRFYPSNKPKALLDLNGTAILERQLDLFTLYDFKRVILTAGHQTGGMEILKSGLRIGSKLGIGVDTILEDEPKGTLPAIQLGLNSIDNRDSLMVCSGDVLTNINLAQMEMQFLKKNIGHKSLFASMLVVKMKSPYGVVKINNNGLVKGFEEKPILNCYINGGYYCFKPIIKEILNKYDKDNIEDKVFPYLADMGQLGYYKEDNPFWMSIDTYKDLELARKYYKETS